MYTYGILTSVLQFPKNGQVPLQSEDQFLAIEQESAQKLYKEEVGILCRYAYLMSLIQIVKSRNGEYDYATANAYRENVVVATSAYENDMINRGQLIQILSTILL